jgi:hypothetical protein
LARAGVPRNTICAIAHPAATDRSCQCGVDDFPQSCPIDALTQERFMLDCLCYMSEWITDLPSIVTFHFPFAPSISTLTQGIARWWRCGNTDRTVGISLNQD